MRERPDPDSWTQARWATIVVLGLLTFGYLWSLPLLAFASFMGATRLWIAVPGFLLAPILLVVLWRWGIKRTRTKQP